MASLEGISARVTAASGPTQCKYNGTLPTGVRSSYGTPEARAHCHTGSTNVYSDGSSGKMAILAGSNQSSKQSSPQKSHFSSYLPTPGEQEITRKSHERRMAILDDQIAWIRQRTAEWEEDCRERDRRRAEMRAKTDIEIAKRQAETKRIIEERKANRKPSPFLTARICLELKNASAIEHQPEIGIDVPDTGLIKKICNLFVGKKDISIPEEIDVLIANLETISPENRVRFLAAKSSDDLFPQARKILGEQLGESKSMAFYQPLLGAIANNSKYKPFVRNVLAVVPKEYHQGLLNMVTNANAQNAYRIRTASMNDM